MLLSLSTSHIVHKLFIDIFLQLKHWHKNISVSCTVSVKIPSDVHSSLLCTVTSSKEKSLHVYSEAPTVVISQVTFNECQKDISINYSFIVNPVLVSTELTCWQRLSVEAYPHCMQKIDINTHHRSSSMFQSLISAIQNDLGQNTNFAVSPEWHLL